MTRIRSLSLSSPARASACAWAFGLGGLCAVALGSAREATAQEAATSVRRIVGEVIEARPGSIVRLSRGAQDGVQERMVFDVYRPARVIGLPMSNEKAYAPEEVFAQVVIVSVDGTASVGRVVEVGGGVKNVPAVSPGNLVASNPFVATLNIPPFIRSLTANPPRTELGGVVTLTVDCTDEPHDLVYYDWTATGGVLSHKRSSVPQVTWRPPVQKGSFRLAVTAVDTAGNKAQSFVEVESAGFTGLAKNVYKPAAHVLGKHTGLFTICTDMAFDEANTAWIIEGDERRVIEVDGDWVPKSRSLDASQKLDLTRAVAAGGHLYAIDTYNTQGVKLRLGAKVLQDKPVATFGAKGVGNGRFQRPIDIAVDGQGRVYILDAYESQPAVHIFDAAGAFVASLGNLGKERGQWTRPVGLAVSHTGRLYVLCDERKRVLYFDGLLLGGEFVAGTGTDTLVDVKVDRFTGRVCVLDSKSGQVRSFDPDGKAIGRPFGKVGETLEMGTWYEPSRLVFDMNGALYLIARRGRVLHRLDPATGVETGRWGGVDLGRATRVGVAPNGDVAMLLPREYVVANLDERGWIQAFLGGRGTGNGKLSDPVDVQVDAQGNVCVLDKGQAMVHVFRPDGTLLRVIGKKGEGARDLDSPIRLATSPDRSALGVLESRRKWNVKLFDMQGNLKAAFPGEDKYLVDAIDLCLTLERVHVAVDNRNRTRYFDVGPAFQLGPLVDGDGQNQFRGGDYAFPDVSTPRRLIVSNLGFMFVLKAGDYVLVRNLANNQDFTQIRAPTLLSDPQDVAVDDIDRVFVWDSDKQHIVVFER